MSISLPTEVLFELLERYAALNDKCLACTYEVPTLWFTFAGMDCLYFDLESPDSIALANFLLGALSGPLA